jgi:hypothetical protein
MSNGVFRAVWTTLGNWRDGRLERIATPIMCGLGAIATTLGMTWLVSTLSSNLSAFSPLLSQFWRPRR